MPCDIRQSLGVEKGISLVDEEKPAKLKGNKMGLSDPLTCACYHF